MAAMILYLWLLVVSVTAQAPRDPIKDFCRRFGHRTAVIDRKLYIDGGWVYANSIAKYPQPAMNKYLLYSDLNITSDDMPKQFDTQSKNDTIPSVAGGVLWEDNVNKVFWQFGGEFQNAPDDYVMYGYDTLLNQWNQSDATQTNVQRVSYGAGISISDAGKAFYYGGYLNQHTTPGWTGSLQVPTSSLIVFDMNDNTVNNFTGPADKIPRAEGVMVSIPASAAGLLIYFGGAEFPSAAYGNYTEEPMNMSTIMIYDIGDAKWYTQTATGDVPQSRRKFCAAATWAPDQSSYQVYLYGGFGFGDQAAGFDDVYILSMPSFEWVKWYGSEPGATSVHGDLTCNIIDGAQMIVMGGNFTLQEDCDVPSIGGQHNLNLGQKDVTSDAKWFKYLPTLSGYQVPTAIINIAGGGPTGAATQTAPAAGWETSALAVYFGGQASYASRTPTRLITATNTSNSHGSKPANIGAIAGGAAGGAVALLLVGICSWWCLKRRRNRREGGRTSPPARHQGQPSEMPDNTTYQQVGTKGSYVGSPYTNSNPPTPYATPPPVMPPQSPQYHHPAHQPSPTTLFPVPQIHQERNSPVMNQRLSPQRLSPQQYEMSASPRQEYFPSPDAIRRNSQGAPIPGMFEMPVARTPRMSQNMYQPMPTRADTQTTSTSGGNTYYYDEKRST